MEIQNNRNNYERVTSSETGNLIISVLTKSEHLETLEQEQKETNRHKVRRCTYNENDNTATIVEFSPQHTSEVTITDLDIFKGKNISACKLFVYVTSQLNKCIEEGKVFKSKLSFSLEDLVRYGLYKNTKTARKGFLLASDKLMQVKVRAKTEGKSNKEGESVITSSTAFYLFTGRHYKNGKCEIWLQDNIDWTPIIEYFTIVPKYIYSLPSSSFLLCRYIFVRIRNNLADLKNRGYVDIKLDTIRRELDLIEPSKTTNPQRDIKEVIEKAICDIEDAQLLTNNGDIQFNYTVESDEKITKWLEGYLRISITGDTLQQFVEIQKTKEGYIIKAEKRSERIEAHIQTNLRKGERNNG